MECFVEGTIGFFLGLFPGRLQESEGYILMSSCMVTMGRHIVILDCIIG